MNNRYKKMNTGDINEICQIGTTSLFIKKEGPGSLEPYRLYLTRDGNKLTGLHLSQQGLDRITESLGNGFQPLIYTLNSMGHTASQIAVTLQEALRDIQPKFTNTCPVTLEPITQDSYLVKVPKGTPKDKNDKPQDKYYYIFDDATLKQLQKCPLTKREGKYFVIKLADLDEEQIKSLKTAENSLIEDNDTLCKLDTSSWKWEEKKFIKQASYQPVTSLAAVNAQINGTPQSSSGFSPLMTVMASSSTATIQQLLNVLASEENGLTSEERIQLLASVLDPAPEVEDSEDMDLVALFQPDPSFDEMETVAQTLTSGAEPQLQNDLGTNLNAVTEFEDSSEQEENYSNFGFGH
jgi:hypothetical protein